MNISEYILFPPFTSSRQERSWTFLNVLERSWQKKRSRQKTFKNVHESSSVRSLERSWTFFSTFFRAFMNVLQYVLPNVHEHSWTKKEKKSFFLKSYLDIYLIRKHFRCWFKISYSLHDKKNLEKRITLAIYFF